MRLSAVLLCLLSSTAFAQDASLHFVDRQFDLPGETAPGHLGFHSFLELRGSDDLRTRPQNRTQQGVHELSLGADYTLDRQTSVTAEISVEQLGGQTSTFFAKQAFVTWSPAPAYASLRLGQQFLPVGLINERDNWFSSNPPWMQELFADSKGIDLGGILDVKPLANSWAYLQGGVFAGRFVREEDNRNQSPVQSPKIISVKSHSEFHDAFLTHFEHTLAGRLPLKSTGLGFELRAPQTWLVRPSLLAEAWQIDQLQSDGPNQRTRAWLLMPSLQWWRLSAGYRYSEAGRRLQSADGATGLPLERSGLWYASVQISKIFALRVERVAETQGEILRNEWVGRLMVGLDL